MLLMALLLVALTIPFDLRGIALGVGAARLRKSVLDAHQQNVARELAEFHNLAQPRALG